MLLIADLSWNVFASPIYVFFRQVTISTPQNTVDAGTKLNFTVKTSSGDSFVGLRAIDRSVGLLLLKSGNDIT